MLPERKVGGVLGFDPGLIAGLVLLILALCFLDKHQEGRNARVPHVGPV